MGNYIHYYAKDSVNAAYSSFIQSFNTLEEELTTNFFQEDAKAMEDKLNNDYIEKFNSGKIIDKWIDALSKVDLAGVRERVNQYRQRQLVNLLYQATGNGGVSKARQRNFVSASKLTKANTFLKSIKTLQRQLQNFSRIQMSNNSSAQKMLSDIIANLKSAEAQFKQNGGQITSSIQDLTADGIALSLIQNQQKSVTGNEFQQFFKGVLDQAAVSIVGKELFGAVTGPVDLSTQRQGAKASLELGGVKLTTRYSGDQKIDVIGVESQKEVKEIQEGAKTISGLGFSLKNLKDGMFHEYTDYKGQKQLGGLNIHNVVKVFQLLLKGGVETKQLTNNLDLFAWHPDADYSGFVNHLSENLKTLAVSEALSGSIRYGNGGNTRAQYLIIFDQKAATMGPSPRPYKVFSTSNLVNLMMTSGKINEVVNFGGLSIVDNTWVEASKGETFKEAALKRSAATEALIGSMLNTSIEVTLGPSFWQSMSLGGFI